MKTSLLSLFVVLCLSFQYASGYNVNMSSISVSGLSSGGFAAVQFHFAYSSSLIGVGVFAGGPYYCAQGSLTTAESTCLFLGSEININSLVSKAQGFASAGNIDSLSNLNGQPVYLYSGELDTVVQRAVVTALEQMYQQVAPHSTINAEFSIFSEHCLPTLDFGNICLLLESPYISKCNYDGAGNALQTIYRNTLAPAGTANSNNIQTLNQQSFIPSGDSTLGVAPNAYVYVPTDCQNGATCGLHVSFHGCNQNYESVSDAYYANGGFNTWAEANNLIILYPQAASDSSANPEGCFDWWGFTGSNYAYKSGVQMATTWNMIQYLASSNTTFTSL